MTAAPWLQSLSGAAVPLLAPTPADDLDGQARALRTAFGGQAVLALRQILTRMHNKGLRDERRLPEV